MKIKTNEFINLLSKAIKGVGNNKLIPITSMMGITVFENTISLHTTDGSNHLYVNGTCVDGVSVDDGLVVTVPATKFASLISKMTCETVELAFKDGNLEVKGNGKYIIELPVDENGEPIVDPNPAKSFIELEFSQSIKVADIVAIKNSLAPALATTLEAPCYCNYYFGENVIATDTYTIAAINKKLFNSMLLPPEMINLLALSNCETVQYCISDNEIYFVADDIEVYGHLASGVEDFAIDAITSLINEDYDYECKIAKSVLLSALERTALFVDTYDRNAVQLTFSADSLVISSKKSNSEELLKYEDTIDFDSKFSCLIDIEMLIAQLKAYSNDVVTIQFGKDSSIKFVLNDAVQILALLND